MNQSLLAPSLIAGGLSALLFILIAISGLGFFFLFIPTLPLFYYGLSKNPNIAFLAAFIASTLIALLTDVAVALVFLCSFGLPAWYIARLGLRSHAGEAARLWMPVGIIFAKLCAYASASVAAVTLYYYSRGEDIGSIIATEIRSVMPELEAQYGQALTVITEHWSFLVVALTFWLWTLALYAHAWFTNRMLVKYARNLRPDMAVVPFRMPGWTLPLMAIAALASLIGSPPLKFLGNCTLMTMLLPYFFLGVALMHKTTENWPSRRFFLIFVYVMIVVQLWPALLLSAIGVFYHIKHLSAPTTSSRS